MNGMPPSLFNQRGQISQQGMSQLAIAQMQFGLSGGPNDVVGPQGITPKPPEIEACFAFIDDFDGNIHAWTEANVSDPNHPIRMEGGRFGRITGTGSGSGGGTSDDHWAAYDFNGVSHEPGTMVYIVRVTWNAWGIICCDSEAGSGSGAGHISIVCADGTVHSATISGNTITEH